MRRTEQGAVSVEFLLAVFPVLLVFFGMVQLALVGVARLVVIHAAGAAARSAAVVLDDSPSRYGGEARGHLARQASNHAEPALGPSRVGSLLESLAPARGESRLEVIRRAASVPLSALAPSPERVQEWLSRAGSPSIERALGAASPARIASGVGAYHLGVLGVSVFADDARDLVRVEVLYLLHCGVPVAARLLCSPLPAAAGGELDRVPSLSVARALAATGERFLALRAQAVWPRQRYHDGGGQGG